MEPWHATVFWNFEENTAFAAATGPNQGGAELLNKGLDLNQDDLTTQFTQVLAKCSNGDEIQEQLTPIIYAQLRAIAQRRMMNERRGHTLQATALVHEALLRLNGDRNVSPEREPHFYSAAAEAMRRVLIDHARKKRSKKRAGNRVARTVAREWAYAKTRLFQMLSGGDSDE